MKRFFRKYGNLIGFDPSKIYSFIRNYPLFLKDYRELKQQCKRNCQDFPFTSFNPFLSDKYVSGGITSGHYFHQDLLVASKIYQSKPNRHIDVGSRVDGFVAHVSVFRKIEVADIRDVNSDTENISYFQLDIMDELPIEYHESTDSLSSLHVIEHLGLGRYGDPIQWEGHITGFNNLTKMLKSGGIFYFSTPIGPQRIEFNAHRVFSVETLINLVSEHYTIEEFSYVDDNGDLHKSVELNKERVEDNYGCNYGCGIFQLRKK